MNGTGTQWLYRILMSESAYLIWKLRNDRVISRDGEPTTEDEITNKWKFAMNQRLQVDRTLANRPIKRKCPALAPRLVLETWSDTLDEESSLLANWLQEPRVLVAAHSHRPGELPAAVLGRTVVPHCPWACGTRFSRWWKPLAPGDAMHVDTESPVEHVLPFTFLSSIPCPPSLNPTSSLPLLRNAPLKPLSPRKVMARRCNKITDEGVKS
jgi:hypothetical protein